MELQSTLQLSPPQLHELFGRCFEGYVVPVQFAVSQFVERMRADGVDFECSRVIQVDGAPQGLMLVARRGAASRLAAMGIVAAARHRGVGRQAVEVLLDEARRRGDRFMVLEVIEQNAPAVALYQSSGFEIVRRLVGFRAEGQGTGALDAEPVDVREFTCTLATHGGLDLPWQTSWESFANLGWPHRALKRGPVWALVADSGEGPIVLKSLVVETEQRRRGHAAAFLRDLIPSQPREWRVPAIAPEEPCADLFQAAGWEREGISQWEMRIDLGAA